MIKLITKLLMKWAKRNGRVFKITGTAGPDDVYLIRYYIIRSNYFNFFIHQFLRSDRDDLHDHPWDFCTYLVSGCYTENKWNEELKRTESTRRCNYDLKPGGYLLKIRQNTFVFRKATDQHQVVVDRDLKESQKDQAATTLFFSGPTKRDWGFIREVKFQNDGVTPISEKYRPIREWVKWTKYLGLPDDTKSRG